MNNPNVNEKVINTTIEILGKPYAIRCQESELASLQDAAAYLNQCMSDVKESGKAINLERIAIMAALNITNQFLQIDKQKNSLLGKITQRINQLQEKLDSAMNKKKQTELLYTIE